MPIHFTRFGESYLYILLCSCNIIFFDVKNISEQLYFSRIIPRSIFSAFLQYPWPWKFWSIMNLAIQTALSCGFIPNAVKPTIVSSLQRPWHSRNEWNFDYAILIAYEATNFLIFLYFQLNCLHPIFRYYFSQSDIRT